MRTPVSLRLIVAVQTHVCRLSRTTSLCLGPQKRPTLLLNTKMWPGAITVVSYGNIASTLLSAHGQIYRLTTRSKHMMINCSYFRWGFFFSFCWCCCCSAVTFWPTCKDVKCACVGSPDLCCDKWASEKPTDFTDESAQFQQLKEDDNSASEVTYGELEQRLGQLQDHLNRCIFLESTHNMSLCYCFNLGHFIEFSSCSCM